MGKTLATALYVLAIFIGIQVGLKLGTGFFTTTTTPTTS